MFGTSLMLSGHVIIPYLVFIFQYDYGLRNILLLLVLVGIVFTRNIMITLRLLINSLLISAVTNVGIPFTLDSQEMQIGSFIDAYLVM